MKDPWRKTRNEQLEGLTIAFITLAGAIATVAMFAYFLVIKIDDTKTNACAKHGMRMSQVRSWSGPVCRDDRGVLYDFGG